MYTTDMYEGVIAETVTLTGTNGDLINAYFARPLGAGPFPAMVLAHHMPGWDDWYREAASERGLEIGKEESREIVYGMPFPEWKKQYQKEASDEQKRTYEETKPLHAYISGH